MLKRSIKKTIFFIFLLTFTCINVKAGLSLEDCVSSIVDETSPGEYAEFDAKEYHCRWEKQNTYSEIGGEEMTYKEAIDTGLEIIETAIVSADGKGLEGASYYRCYDKDAKVFGRATYIAKYDGDYHAATYKCSKSGYYSKKECESNGGSWDIAEPAYYYCGLSGTKQNSRRCEDEIELTSPDYNAYDGETIYKGKIDQYLMQQKKDIELSFENCTVTKKKTYYGFKCPDYKCIKEEFTFGACTPKFKTPSGDAYCINPNESFGSSYRADDFDVTKCKNSYSTVDCGYANILIEGEYYDYTYQQINLAMRMWGMYTGRSGFEDGKVGISWITADPGGGVCTRGENGDRVFVEPLYNVYKHTYEQYFKDLLHSLPESIAHISALDCNSAPLAVACIGAGHSPTETTLNIAYKLLHSTISGNERMFEMLEELYGSFAPSPTGISFEGSDDSEDTDVIVHYGDVTSNTKKNVEIDCRTLDENSPEYIEIAPYCKDKIIFIDQYGMEHEEKPVSCIKNVGCTYKNIPIAFCDITSTNQKIIVIHKKSKPDISVQKLESCVNVGDQMMFTIITGSDQITETPGEPEYETEERIEYGIPSYTCSGSCENYDPRESDPSCKYDSGKMDGEISEGYVKDPSLKCIVNMPSAKERYKYDYSENFGVNTNFCRVFCSDEVEYTVSDRVTINSGKDMRLNIGSKSGLDAGTKMLSTTVKEKRSCVSEIYFDDLEFNDEISANWKTMYNLSSNPKSILDLYNMLSSKSSSQEANRQENLNQVLYDLYNCNFYRENQIPSIVTRPKDNTIGNVYNYMIDNYFDKDKWSYGLGKNSLCKIDDNNNTCITMETISYTGGAELDGTTDKQKAEEINRVGGTKVTDKQIEVESITKQDFSNITYCKGADCYNYDENKDLASYNYPTNSNSTTTLRFKNRDVVVPSNTYALFTVTTIVGFYNDSLFQTVPGSGYIIDAKSSDANINYIDLPPYTYPVSKDAYLLCEDDSKEIRGSGANILDNSTRSCRIVYKYANVETYFRKNPSDKFTQKVKGDYLKQTCYYDVKTTPPKTPTTSCSEKNACIPGDTVEYKNVDKASLFPNTINTDNNWNTSWSNKVQEYVEQTGTPEQKLSEEYLEYRITLTPAMIRDIRKYNSKNSNYQNSALELGSCEKVEKNGITKYYNCRSQFMNDVRSGLYADIDIDHNGSSILVNSALEEIKKED